MYSGNRKSHWDKKNKLKRKLLAAGMAVLTGMTVICAVYSSFTGEKPEGEKKVYTKLTEYLQRQMTETYTPVFAFMEDETGKQVSGGWFERRLAGGFPIYGYSEDLTENYVSLEDENTCDLLIRQEGADEDKKEIEDGSLEYGEDALHIDGELERAMMEENKLHSENAEKEEAEEKEKKGEQERSQYETDGFLRADNKSYEYDWNELAGYEELVSAFYAVDKTTSVTDDQLNLDNLRNKDMTMKASADSPQILIYHTHSQESFVDSVPGDTSTTLVGAGERLSQILREEYGFNVIHHTGEYDVEARDYAYSNALPAVEQVLAEHPSVEVVIDLHRDAVPEGRKLAVSLQGRPTAQFMFFNGLSRTRQKGNISYLENPYINDNLAFSFQAQVASNEYYPGIARRIYLKAYRYNMHLRAKSLLIELGAQTNTVEEIMNACDPLAHVIALVLGAGQ